MIAAANTKNYLSGYLSSSNTQGFLTTESGSELHVTGWYVQNSWGYIRGAGKVFLEGRVAVNQYIGLSAGTDVTIGTMIERVTASSPFSIALSGGWGNLVGDEQNENS